MKKAILYLGLLLVLFPPLSAQDSILHLRDMRLMNNYLVPVWPDSFPTVKIDGKDYLRGWMALHGENWNNLTDEAESFYTDDTVQVYGIMAGLTSYWRFYPDSYEYTGDTSCEYLYDYLRLYEAEPDSLRQLGEDLLVNLRHTPVSYYLDLDLVRDRFDVDYWPLLPMYERYFSTPITVTDSFYVGRHYRPNHYWRRGDVFLLELTDSKFYISDPVRYQALYMDYIGQVWDTDTWTQHDTVYKGWVYGDITRRQNCPFLFPIIAPPDTSVHPCDTVTPGALILYPGRTLVIAPGDILVIGGDTVANTSGDTLVVTPGDTLAMAGITYVIHSSDTLVVTPGDTLVVHPDGSITTNPGGTVAVNPGYIPGNIPDVGIRSNPDFVYRYTSVQPNPATDRVKVLSSFGLTRIEVYDTRGRLLHDLPASGLKVTLDVSSWPRGTYLLRITTPVGQTTKKLLIQ